MQKIERILFYLLIFFLPFGTRMVLKSWGGEFNEWNSAFFYLNDVFLLATVFLWALRVRGKILEFDIVNVVLLFFLLWNLLSIIVSENYGISIYRLIKFFELTVFFWYVRGNIYQYYKTSKLEKIIWIIIASGLVQVVVAGWQFINQRAIGLIVLDESPIAPDVAGVAKLAEEGVKIVRSYGLLPHPNILGAFLLLGVALCLILVFIYKRSNFLNNILPLVSLAILMLGIFFSFSRYIILSLLLMLIMLIILPNISLATKGWNKVKVISIYLFAFLSFGLVFKTELFSRFTTINQGYGLSSRILYNQVAEQLILAHPLLGVGVGNYVWTVRNSMQYAWQVQPVHNIFLLIASEGGVIAGILFIGLLYLILSRGLRYVIKTKEEGTFKLFNIIIFVTVILITGGLFDHYIWTIWQGQLMLWLCLGIISASTEERAEV
ncbi:MAG: hypothetical protein COU81_03655 [Candidatus Portnoybacteria bacterium CG10_big_fil_rev_8_21_14_0_10_36_7]|uniref:O-antigen ligase-related domain-containing protein n=1 Tax=Candidatus Portnoybacteria bacterium CG10_big_fil_rev_8_21_14_0_10_36_7 TaxID=1974812 RepID=A0A2M8KD88_9BACT|nr:MAG: hypothetical protein COU81_03655 [Candidatus Portnoybacteria bacterium CG10_big_fil_rev_8_21_14_0_10_36_7]